MWRPGRQQTAERTTGRLAPAVHRPPIETGHGTCAAVRQFQFPGALIGTHPTLRQHSTSVRMGVPHLQFVRVPGSRLLPPRGRQNPRTNTGCRDRH